MPRRGDPTCLRPRTSRRGSCCPPTSTRCRRTCPPESQTARLRLEKRFDVRVRNMEVPVSSLWALDLDSKRTTRLTRDTTYSVGDFTISDDGKFIGYRGISANRYERNILEQNNSADLYLLEVGSGACSAW